MSTNMVNSLSEYLIQVKQFSAAFNAKPGTVWQKTVWFRGQANPWPLLPLALREPYDEYHILSMFKSLYKNYTTERFDGRSIELFAYMQHYGVPTRLLDWTEGALLALFFALETALPADQPCVFLLHAPSLNTLTIPMIVHPLVDYDLPIISARLDMIPYVTKQRTGEPKLDDLFFAEHREYEHFRLSPDKLTFPVAFHPASASNPRIVAQRGTFTVHGLQERPLEDVLEEANSRDSILRVDIVPANVSEILGELAQLGVSHRTAYPDLYGLSRELRGESYKWR